MKTFNFLTHSATSKGLLIAMLLPLGYFSAYSQSGKDKYVFHHKTSPKEIKTYSLSAFTRSDNTVSTASGVQLVETRDSINNYVISPVGNAFGMVTTKRKKKEQEAFVYSTHDVDKKLFKLDTQKYGQPTSMVYFPDGRTLAIGTDKGIFFYDSRKYLQFSGLPNVPFAPTRMIVSPNGYYLAAINGSKVVVFNIEARTIRWRQDMEEKINDIAFSPDNSDFAVLTDDGLLNIYNTRSFDFRKMIDNLGEGLACAYNFDGKYIAVVTSPASLAVVNLLRDTEREYYAVDEEGMFDVEFIANSGNETYMIYPRTLAVESKKMPHLKPYYNRLIADELDMKMAEWQKMMPGETMEEYKLRVTDESRARQRRLFEDEISTNLAGNLLENATMSLGSYDRANGVLAINFDSMPTIYIPVPESEVGSFRSADDLSLEDVQYGILPDDSFEIVYAKVINNLDGKFYIYDNLERASMNYMAAEDAISLELLQQQQMEEMKLQELREKVLEEAKSSNIISDHTNIAVDSRVVPDYDADGNKILNYKVTVTYDVEPAFSVVEDFAPGKYHVAESGAASSMLKIVKEAFEGDFKKYVEPGKKVKVTLIGTADATPIVRGIPYDGAYGQIEDEPVYKDGALSAISVTTAGGIKENEQLALVRALGIKDYLEKNVDNFKDMNTDYRYEVNVSKSKGSEFRRISVDFTFIDVF